MNIIVLVKSPNKITLAVFAVVIIVIALLCFIDHRIAARKQRKLKRKEKVKNS